MGEIIHQEDLKTVKSSIYILIRKDIRDELGITKKNAKNFSSKLVYDKDTKEIKLTFIYNKDMEDN